ncbi:MAG: hypothetical protein WBC44_20175 [Planctomycetaceae bacterium]
MFLRLAPAVMLSVGLVACLAPKAVAEEPLLKYLPGETTNVVAVVRVADIVGGGEAADSKSRWPLPGGEAIPGSIERLVVGSHVRLGTRDRVQTIALAAVPSGTTVAAVPMGVGGTPDRIGDRVAVVTGRGDYLVDLAPGTAALVHPGVRQEVSRWLEATTHEPLPPFLTEAAAKPQEIVLAIDLRNTLSADRVTPWLETRPGKHDAAETAAVAALLTKLVGASVAIDVGTTNTAEIRARFSEPVSAPTETLRRLFGDLLREAHASIPEIESAEAVILGSDFVLKTPISDGTLRRVMSMIVAPPTPEPKRTTATRRTETPASPAEASLTYFEAVDGLVNDLEAARRRSNDYSRTATWHDNFAAKIEQLPTIGVDPALVDYGYRIASGLRALGASLRGQAVDVTAQQQSVTYDVQVRPGFVGYNVWGGVGYAPSSWQATSNLQQVRERQAEAVTAGAGEREEVWAKMTEDRATTARAMSEKLGVPFGQTKR